MPIRGAWLSRYGLLAFTTGFVLMAFELVAARLLAPSLGTSIYVWTSVIGVMIAALAAGYAVGGWLADHRTKPTDIVWLLLLTALAVLSTLAAYHSVLTGVTAWISDARLQAVVAATCLFLPTSFILGTISPYLARLQTQSINTTGRTVASLSALNSLGGITGTFAAGFWLFSWIGSQQTLLLLAILLALASWLPAPAAQRKQRLIAGMAAAGLIGLYSLPTTYASSSRQIDTATARYSIVELDYDGAPIRGLMMGPGGIQSATSQWDPNALALRYTSKIAQLVERLPNRSHILILGGGAFSLPEYFGRHYPSARIDVVEIDPQLPGIAQAYFDYQPQPGTSVYAADARPFLQQTTNHYDLVIVDAYSDIWVPFALTTREFTSRLSGILNPGGVVLANIIGSSSPACAPYVSSLDASYGAAFSQAAVFPVTATNLGLFQNLIMAYSNAPLDWAAGDHTAQTFPAAGAVKLTDDFAPVEPLLQRCLAHRHE